MAATEKSIELDDLGLPKHAEPIAVVGSVGVGRRSEVRVAVHEGRFGMRIDLREWCLPPTPEQQRIHAGRKAGASQRKDPYVGPTRTGWRMDLADALRLATLILEAGGVAEDHLAAVAADLAGIEGVA